MRCSRPTSGCTPSVSAAIIAGATTIQDHRGKNRYSVGSTRVTSRQRTPATRPGGVCPPTEVVGEVGRGLAERRVRAGDVTQGAEQRKVVDRAVVADGRHVDAVGPQARVVRRMAGGRTVRAFRSIGWGWGGSWTGNTKDYMHFSSSGH